MEIQIKSVCHEANLQSCSISITPSFFRLLRLQLLLLWSIISPPYWMWEGWIPFEQIVLVLILFLVPLLSLSSFAAIAIVPLPSSVCEGWIAIPYPLFSPFIMVCWHHKGLKIRCVNWIEIITLWRMHNDYSTNLSSLYYSKESYCTSPYTAYVARPWIRRNTIYPN